MAIYFVDIGKAACSLAMTLTTAQAKYLSWGTGAAQSVTATGLTTEKAVDLSAGADNRTLCTMSQVTTTLTNDTYQAVGTRTATGAGTVTELGLHTAITGASTLVILADSQSVLLAIGDSIAATFKLKFA